MSRSNFSVLCKLYKLYALYKLYKCQNGYNTKNRRTCRVGKIFLHRKTQGDYHNLVREMKVHDKDKYFNYLRVTVELFEELLNLIGPKIKKNYHTIEPIAPAEKLTLTLRYLASGDSMTSLSYSYRLGKSTISYIIYETCTAIWETLYNQYLLSNPCADDWKKIANEYNEIWQFPHCIGAIDGKHCVIQAPPNSGSDFFNYKHSFSIILLAVCDAKYKFTMIDLGAQGRQSDGGVLRHSDIGRRLYNDELNIPQAVPLIEDGNDVPYFLVGDEAFPLRENIMRPFPGRFLPLEKRVFNYRLSRARRVIENCFGILVSRWRIYRKPLMTSLQTSEAVIKATLCLHNFLMTKNDTCKGPYCPPNYTDVERNGVVVSGLWRREMDHHNNMRDIGRSAANTYSQNASSVRNELTSYFMTEGALDFQWNK